MIVTTERPIHLQTNIWVLDVPFLAKQEQVCHVEFEIFHYQETAFVLKLKMTLEIDLFLELSMTLEIDLVLELSMTLKSDLVLEISIALELDLALELSMILEFDLLLELPMTLEIDLVLESSVTQETALFVCTADLLRCLYIPVYHSKAVPV